VLADRPVPPLRWVAPEAVSMSIVTASRAVRLRPLSRLAPVVAGGRPRADDSDVPVLVETRHGEVTIAEPSGADEVLR
jgi:hypothetical protein